MDLQETDINPMADKEKERDEEKLKSDPENFFQNLLKFLPLLSLPLFPLVERTLLF